MKVSAVGVTQTQGELRINKNPILSRIVMSVQRIYDYF